MNQLYGLSDGFLYPDLIDTCAMTIENNKVDLQQFGTLLACYRALGDLELIVEKIESLPSITEDEAHKINLGV